MARRAALIWSAPALDDLDEIASYIAQDNQRAAASLVKRVLAVVKRLEDHPESGRRVPEILGLRYREVIVPPCRIVYRREGANVLIVYVFRSERQLRASRLF